MLESKHHKLASKPAFIKRMLASLAVGGAILTAGLLIGVLGYHFIAGLGWIDAVLNSAMILTGMGPVDHLQDDAAKLFASVYALFSGLVFLTVFAVVLSPLMHRMLHRFHIDDNDLKK